MFIAVEGVDGAGCGTQATQLHEHLSTDYDTRFYTYPDYDHALGMFIKQYLYGEFSLPPKAEFLLYAADMVKDGDDIFAALQEDKLVVADRHLPSTLAYQSVNGTSVETITHFVKLFEIPVPDLVVYLDVDVETAQTRKQGEKDELDKYEQDTGFREKVRTQYKTLMEEKPLGMDWVEVDATPGIDTVQNSVRTAVETHLEE